MGYVFSAISTRYFAMKSLVLMIQFWSNFRAGRWCPQYWIWCHSLRIGWIFYRNNKLMKSLWSYYFLSLLSVLHWLIALSFCPSDVLFLSLMSFCFIIALLIKEGRECQRPRLNSHLTQRNSDRDYDLSWISPPRSRHSVSEIYGSTRAIKPSFFFLFLLSRI